MAWAAAEAASPAVARPVPVPSPPAPGRQVLPDQGSWPVLPALRDLLAGGVLRRGSVTAVTGLAASADGTAAGRTAAGRTAAGRTAPAGQPAGGGSLLCLALAAAASADGAWCAAAGLPDLGVRAAVDAGVDPDRLLLVACPGPGWPQVVAALLDGCEIVILRPPARPPAQLRRKVEAAARRHGGILIVAGDWDGAAARLQVTRQEWTGIGCGHGRLHARRAQVTAEGRGAWSRPRARWLWLPGPDGAVTPASPPAAVTPPVPGVISLARRATATG